MSTTEDRPVVLPPPVAFPAGEENPPPPPPPRPVGPSFRSNPRRWLRQNLFKDANNTVLTILLGAVLIGVVYGVVRFVATGNWELTKVELINLMVGQNYPKDNASLAKLWYAIYDLAVVSGLAAGVASQGRATWRRWAFLRDNWPLLLGVLVLFTRVTTLTPVILTLGALAVGLAFRELGRILPMGVRRFLPWVYGVLLLAIVPILLPVTLGLDGPVSTLAIVGFVVGIALFLAFEVLGRRRPSLEATLGPIALSGLIVAGLIAMQHLVHVDLDPIEQWGGLLLTITVAVAAIVLSFPLGMLLALGRRSSFRLIRPLCVGYIELIRGVPLITLLFAGQFLIGFFLPSGVDIQGDVTKATIMITLFSAAYCAEIIRGGLQAVPKGQLEAGRAIGMTQLKINRLIVLPQALRAVIPALVGHFISLVKDTSLLVIIGIAELLGAAQRITAQQEFRLDFFEALVFVAFLYWVLCSTMSRASQRLELRLGVGTR